MDKIDKILYERYMDLEMLATEPVFKSKNPPPKLIAERFENLLQHAGYASLSFFNMSRKRIVDSAGRDEGKIHSLSEYWPDIATGKDSVIDFYLSESLHIPLFHIVVVVKDNTGARMGVLVARMSIDSLDEIIKVPSSIQPLDKALEEASLTKVDLVNKKGLVIYSNYSEKGILRDTSGYWEYINADIGRGEMSKRYHLRLSGKRENLVLFSQEKGFKNYKGNGWILIAHVPSEVAFAPAIELRNRLITYLLAISGFSLLLILLFAHTISRPIMRLSAVAKEIGQGHLDVDVKIDSNDEVADLAKNMDMMAHNLSASRRALEKIQDLLLRQKKLASIGILSAGVAHEILNPLNIIGTIAQLQMMDEPKGSTHEKMREILDQIQRAVKVVKNLGMFASKNRMESEDLHLPACFDQAAGSMETDLKVGNITIERHFAFDASAIKGDATQLKQVFLILISNARDAMSLRGNGTITVATRFVEHGIEFKLCDDGPGIPSDILEKVFDPFFTTKDPHKGTGLGLSIAHRIIEDHGGTITVESEAGKGACFTIFLPKESNPLAAG